MKHKGIAIVDDGMARVRSTLITHDNVGGTGKDVHNFPLAFISPLRPDYDQIGHATHQHIARSQQRTAKFLRDL